MALFLSVLVLFVLFTVGTILVYRKGESEWGDIVLGTIAMLLAYTLLVVAAFMFSANPDKVEQFVFEKPYIQGSDNYLLVEKKNDWNEWLRRSQRSKKTWGAFSLHPDEVLTLTPIE